jgi:hypothetical protein
MTVAGIPSRAEVMGVISMLLKSMPEVKAP